jgi:hypothetical protein
MNKYKNNKKISIERRKKTRTAKMSPDHRLGTGGVAQVVVQRP